MSRVTQTRARNRGEGNAATAIIADPTADGDGGGGGGGGGGGVEGGGNDNDGGGGGPPPLAERTADEVVDRRALFGFVERNHSLRYLSI